MPQSQGLSNNSYPEPNQPNSPNWYLSLQGPFLSTPRPPQNFESTPTFLRSCYMPCPSQSNGRSKLSVQFRDPVWWRFWTPLGLQCEVVSLSTSPRAGGPLLSTTAYSIYSQLTYISGGLLPHPQPRGRAMPWWQKPTDGRKTYI